MRAKGVEEVTAPLTEDSLRTHGALRYQLTEDSRLEVEGKGDRKWKVREETSHHCVTKVTRETAPIVAPSPLGTPDEMMSLAAIEHEPRFARAVRALR